MLHKFNPSVLSDYSQRFARQICDEFFTKNTVASGHQILELTAIPQVNLFVISNLYEKWKADAEAFRSPYFDFEKAEVKEAMTQFMNTVSRNISVKREHLEPMLADATKNTLVLLVDPSGYFNEIFRNQPNFTVTPEAIQQLRKYTRFNQFVPQAVFEAMQDRTFIYVNQAIEWTERAISQNTSELESVEKWAAVFSEKIPLEVAHLLKKAPKAEPPKAIEPEPGQSFFDTLTPLAPPTPPASIVPAEPIPTPPPVPQAPVAVAPVVPQASPQTVNEVMSTNGTNSLNDRLRSEQATISDTYQNQPIASIGQSMSLNQRLGMIHQLFGGSVSAYEVAISELETAPDFETARGLITYKFASQYLWDMTSDTVGDLLEIVKRRFGQ